MHISGWGNTNRIHIVPAAPEPQRGTQYSTRSAQLTSPLLGLPDLGHLSTKCGRDAKIHHEYGDFLERQAPPKLLMDQVSSALVVLLLYSQWRWEREWKRGLAFIYGLLKQFLEQGDDGKVLLYTQTWRKRACFVGCGFFWVLFLFGNNPAHCVKTKIKTNPQKTNPALLYLKCKHFSIMSISSWMNTNHSFPEGEGGYSNTISEYQDKASVHMSTCHLALRIPWNSGILNHTTGITHHSPHILRKASTGTSGITHQREKNQTKS